MTADRLREAASLLRTRATDAQGLNWEASQALEKLGFSNSTVALALADWLDTQVARADEIASWRQVAMRYGQEDEEKAALAVADAILGAA